MPPSLKRNNTVTGSESRRVQLRNFDRNRRIPSIRSISTRGSLTTPRTDGDQPTERSEARMNLMRKLSARRLATPAAPVGGRDRLGVVGRIGRARPRSGSVGGLDWRLGGDATELSVGGPTALPDPAASLDPEQPLPVQTRSAAQDHGIGMGIRMDGRTAVSPGSSSTRRQPIAAAWKDPERAVD